MLLGLAGCIAPQGPIFGDWSGRQPGGDGLTPNFINLVLKGTPGARTGQYEFRASLSNPLSGGLGSRSLRWSDSWTLSPDSGPGAPMTLTLHHLPSGQIARYALLGNGVLVPFSKAGQPDTSRYGQQYELTPVPRTNYSYGRV